MSLKHLTHSPPLPAAAENSGRTLDLRKGRRASPQAAGPGVVRYVTHDEEIELMDDEAALALMDEPAHQH
ncbi:hypothetical protein [Agrobacterium vitis]|uniref:hypothetical protein n=1 Tax=Agrobacterium vitis TaxID=373 RepID=UPI0015725C82|nr:hypothetical protein [Agrobacterium vitis]NSZ19492.1 hypothetical protein [Agrobacterium vitis]QZO06806.1 hypothetical protein K4831_22015 [Agrobacterium vitis]UJL91538.1 hypothetical protein AVF2S5_26535 [Agrobacterium vitis]BCH62599.1 hypothetical protein RvVAR0630_pl07410 [Agrobacterium vitis]